MLVYGLHFIILLFTFHSLPSPLMVHFDVSPSSYGWDVDVGVSMGVKWYRICNMDVVVIHYMLER